MSYELKIELWLNGKHVNNMRYLFYFPLVLGYEMVGWLSIKKSLKNENHTLHNNKGLFFHVGS